MDFHKLSKYLFFAFLFLLPLQTVYLLREAFVGGEKWQYGSIALYVGDIFLFAAVVSFVVSGGYIRKMYDLGFRNYEKEKSGSWLSILKSSIINHKSEALLVLLVVWSAFSIIWSQDQALAGYFFAKLLLAAGAFFMARSLSDEDVKTAIKLLIIGAVLESLLGAWQFLSQSTFASTLLGMSVHEVAEAGTSVLKNDVGRWLRAYGTFPHPNMLGGFLAIMLVMSVSYLVAFGKSIMRTVIMSREELKKSGASLRERFVDTVHMSLVAGAGILIILGLILTFSRSAWLGAAFGIVFLGVSFFFQNVTRNDDRRSRVTFLKMLGVLGIAGMIFVGVLHETVFPRFDSAAIEREGSVSERVQSLEDAKMIIGKEDNIWNMLLGTGIGNSTAEMMLLQPGRSVWSIQPAHNVPILVFAELGLVGLVLFLGFLVSLLPSILKSGIVNQKSALLVTLLPIALLDHYLWTSHFGLLFFFILLGLAARKS